MKKLLSSILFAFIYGSSVQAQTLDTLYSGTMVPITFSKAYCTNSSDQVTAFISRDVTSPNGKVIIRGGEVVNVSVEIKKSRSYGRPASIKVTAVSTLAIDGTVIKLNGSDFAEGEDLKTSAWITSCGFGILLPGVGLLYGLFVHGGDACLMNLPLIKTIETVSVRVR